MQKLLSFTLLLIATISVTSASAQLLSKELPAKLQFGHNEAFYGYANGKLYIMGGKRAGKMADSIWSLDLANPVAWVPTLKMPSARMGGTTVTYNGKFYLLGGVSEVNFGQGPTSYTYVPEVWEYDPMQNTIAVKAAMPVPGWNSPGALVGSKVFVLGGQLSRSDSAQFTEQSDKVQIYNIEADTWKIGDNPAPFKPDYSTAVSSGSDIFFLGNRDKTKPWGYKGNFDGTWITWTPINNPTQRSFAMAAAVMNGSVYVAAGAKDETGGAPLSTVSRYDPSSDAWVKAADFPTSFQAGFFVPLMPTDGSAMYYFGGTGNESTIEFRAAQNAVDGNASKKSQVFPNPASSFITISGELRPTSIEVTNAAGQTWSLRGVPVSKGVAFDIEQLPAGCYQTNTGARFLKH